MVKILITFVLLLMYTPVKAQEALSVAVVGLSHDHAHEILDAYRGNRVNLLRIAEKDKNLVPRYKKDYQVPDALFFPDTETMLKKISPYFVLAYSPKTTFRRYRTTSPWSRFSKPPKNQRKR